ncbi:uncharacterized protein LOC112046791 [Bicyclus anynana]|uniref:Uncharacterized protein LOC112046791 n=1 Tax=Bicyclus anynana TaxID=110368 RepID=A0A6J1MXM8_BICAN|nr:uncharacterized protein LOC112046791 [Bicyclus anynana]
MYKLPKIEYRKKEKDNYIVSPSLTFFGVSFEPDRFVAKCKDMCPAEEVDRRKSEEQVHKLEIIKPGTFQLVKSNLWSIVNTMEVDPNAIRTFNALSDTVTHLLLKVPDMFKKGSNAYAKHMLYSFLDDRFMAVRQDMQIQELPPQYSVVLLEPMIRVYIYYGYCLFDEHPFYFDRALNRQNTLECIKWFLDCCDRLDRTELLEIEMHRVTKPLKSILEIFKCRPELSVDRNLIESVNILFHLKDVTQAANRYLTLPDYVKKAPPVKLAFEIAKANMHNNYTRVLKLSKELCPLTYAVLGYYIPELQKKGLQIMSAAYHSRHRVIPTKDIYKQLNFWSPTSMANQCQRYGLDVDHSQCEPLDYTDSCDESHCSILFEKDMFLPDVEPKLMAILSNLTIMNLEEVFTYYTGDPKYMKKK